jgi:RHS repeat-associated protein
LTQNLRFPGQYADAETGYHHNGFRDYDPALGRYLESDPLGLAGGLNTYAYAAGNPNTGADPSGLRLLLNGQPIDGPLPGYVSNNGDEFSSNDGMACPAPGPWGTGGASMVQGDPLRGISDAAGNLAGGITFAAGLIPVASAELATEGVQTPLIPLELETDTAAATGANFAVKAAVNYVPKGVTFLYQKLGPLGQHLKYGITKNPITRYSGKRLLGGKLNLVAWGSKEKMLQLERLLHETLPLGPEERQFIYVIKQMMNGLKPFSIWPK